MTNDDLFRIEAEVTDEIAAEILRETIENNPDCTLTAFDQSEKP